MKKTIFVIGFAATFITMASFAFGANAEEICMKQYKYFQKLYSIQFDSKVCVTLSKDILLEQPNLSNQLIWEIKFISNGSKYRSEVTSIDPIKRLKKTFITTYNGEDYRILEIGEKSILYLKKSWNTDNPYNGTITILTPFQFAFQKGDIGTIETLKKTEIWQRLANKAIEVKSFQKLGYKGINITFKVSDFNNAKERIYEVFFAEDLDYYPIFWRTIDPTTKRCDEISVLEMRIYNIDNDRIFIPIRITGEEKFNNGGIAQTGSEEINPQTVKINQPVNNGIFTLSVFQANAVHDSDTGIWFYPNQR
ncbi:MAG TPA: hypothetical protein PKN80_03420 [bacterium]|nr:hypothetical protein [bacterium]